MPFGVVVQSVMGICKRHEQPNFGCSCLLWPCPFGGSSGIMCAEIGKARVEICSLGVRKNSSR